MKSRIHILLALCLLHSMVTAQNLVIQEGEVGFCSVDGLIDSNVAGYTGQGYANVDNYMGASIVWSVELQQADSIGITWRYANGGGSGDRYGVLWLNDSIPADTINFAHTGAWTEWAYCDTVHVYLDQGVNRIRVVALEDKGLPNVDYIELMDGLFQPSACMPTHSLRVDRNLEMGGVVSYEPIKLYYEHGDTIALIATPADGYFFHSWAGSVPSAQQEYSYVIKGNTVLSAMFYPNGTTMNHDAVGYATIQDDYGTPFMLIGGALGDTVEATSKADLERYLGSDEHFVVTVSGKIKGEGQVTIRSNKTLLGVTDSAHIEGIMLQISEAQNVIIQNIILSHVVRYDEIEITHGSRNIWIDRCELYTDRNHHQDYYDGLIDIKNGASFITVSRSILKSHFKAMLISSGDQQVQDTVVRITYHHNYFLNLNSRIPSIRFGKAHIFNNYYRYCGDAINTRMGACVRVERNYFEGVGKAVHSDYSPEGGFVQLIDNYFGTSSFIEEPQCVLNVPYPYEHILLEASQVPEHIVGKELDENGDDTPSSAVEMYLFPNPSASNLRMVFHLPSGMNVWYEVFDLSGRRVMRAQPTYHQSGRNQVSLPAHTLERGMYIVRLNWASGSTSRLLQMGSN